MVASGFVVGLLVAAVQSPSRADTLVLSAEEAFERAVAVAPAVEAARRRAAAAAADLEQAGAWVNPTFSVTSENLGASSPISGVGGVSGIEGQAVIAGWLPLGGDRQAARSQAAARAGEGRALTAVAEARARLLLVQSLSRWRQDEARLRRARQEADALGTFAVALAAQAERGRVSEGEASRAHLAMVSATSIAAEAEATAAASRTALATVLGFEPSTQVTVSFPDCAPFAPAPASREEPPDATAARARQAAAAARVAQRRAAAVPDLVPQIGLRRAAGVSALYAGFSIALPLFDRGQAGQRAAVEEAAAAAAELDGVVRALAMEETASRLGVAALEGVGRQYGEEWVAALERTVSSAEARYRLGEGTLTELLDGRRARLTALDDYERWRADLTVARARLARATGAVIDPTTLCEPAPLTGVRNVSEPFNPENRP